MSPRPQGTKRDAKEHMTAGIDPGASSVKVAIVKSRGGEDGEILAKGVERIRRRGVRDVVESVFADACAQAGIDPEELDYVASTGDGETVELRTGHFYSMTTHARGALFLVPGARACLDAGALHARAIAFDDRGKVNKHRMTSQCASGSGQFLENITRYLGVPLEDVGTQSLASKEPEKCSGVCAVLAETDVINMVSRGIATPDILKGIHLSIASRLVRLLRAIGADGEVALTGGLAADEGFVAAIREVIADKQRDDQPMLDARAHPDSILAGALGAALLGAYRYQQLERQGRLEVVAA
jgi:bcr-type benzoyl-CoA reductase subunit D